MDKMVIRINGDELIPRFSEPDQRSKQRESVSYFDNGNIKSVYLEGFRQVHTPMGVMQAEMITFYDTGEVNRVFPVYGQISGFWSEAQEGELVPKADIHVGENEINCRIGCYHFYKSGRLKSVTLWPGDRVNVKAGAYNVLARFGISFYESGAVRSVEPSRPAIIKIKDLEFEAFDHQAIGISGDNSSLCFYENGDVKSLVTSTTALIITMNGSEYTVEEVGPILEYSPMSVDMKVMSPIKYQFDRTHIAVTDAYGTEHVYAYADVCLKTKHVGYDKKKMNNL